MDRTLHSTLLRRIRILGTPEAVCIAVVVLAMEVAGPYGRDDVDDIIWVLFLPLMFMFGCSVLRFRHMPITQIVIDKAMVVIGALRRRLALTLGLDFHPGRAQRLPPFSTLRRASLHLGLVAVALLPAQGLLRDLLAQSRVTGLFTVYVIALCVIWTLLMAGFVLHVPASMLAVLEIVKARAQLEGMARFAVVALVLVAIGTFLVVLDAAVGLTGCVAALAFACILPRAVRIAEPPGAPMLNIALGQSGPACTIRLGDLVRDIYQLCALESFLLVLLLAPTSATPEGTVFPITDVLLRVYGWSAVWLYTGGALLALGEFDRRRRLFDPAFQRTRVLWCVPGPEANSLLDERGDIEATGWRLVVSESLPGPDDADLLVGLPAGLKAKGPVPLVQVPAATFLLSDNPGAVLAEVDEHDKALRARHAIERLLTTMRPRLGDRGEGTFLVPHCWLVVGLTRDDERGNVDRPPSMAFGQTFQAALGTRLRRFFHEVASRADIDVLYVEDAVTPAQVGDVLTALFERHIQRTEPGPVSERDFIGLGGVRVVLHDVDPELDGIEGVDAHVTRHAISRARIMIITRDRRDDDDDDGPPGEGESNDLWLQDSLRAMFPRLQPV